MAFFGFHFAQLTNSFCSFHSDFWIFCHSTLKFLICPCKMSFSTSLLFILCRWYVMCLQRQWQKKFTNLNLKEIQHEAEKKNWSSFKLCIKHAVVTFFFLFFEIETWKPMYPMMLKCNVCIAQCLLIGYYKTSDQSNKVVQFSTAEKCAGPSVGVVWFSSHRAERD